MSHHPLHFQLPRHREEERLLEALVGDAEEADWLVLADWLEEYDDSRRAELVRLHRQLLSTCCAAQEHPERVAGQQRLVQLLSEGVCPSVPLRRVSLGAGVEMCFAWIGPGTFVMGSPPEEPERGDDEPQHVVELTLGYWLGITPVTQAQWQAVMGNNPSAFQGPEFPVETLSWEDAVEFCKQLSHLPQERKAKHVYRLPTEAQWEYSCRGGADSTYPFHFGKTLTSHQANFDGNCPYGTDTKGPYLERTTRVGSYVPNAFGLYDMHGNVWEWCHDWYDADYYTTSPRCDPPGPSEGSSRVFRGGSWNNFGQHCRSADRDYYSPEFRFSSLGFRVALVPSVK